MVQLAPFRGGASGVDYAELRDAQFHAAKVLPRVGLAVITDAGDEADIHPQEKEPVGARLALAARAIAYGEKVEFSGPVYKSVPVRREQGGRRFDHVGGGLVAKGDELNGFTVAGEDGKFHPAKADDPGRHGGRQLRQGGEAGGGAVRVGELRQAGVELVQQGRACRRSRSAPTTSR